MAASPSSVLISPPSSGDYGDPIMSMLKHLRTFELELTYGNFAAAVDHGTDINTTAHGLEGECLPAEFDMVRHAMGGHIAELQRFHGRLETLTPNVPIDASVDAATQRLYDRLVAFWKLYQFAAEYCGLIRKAMEIYHRSHLTPCSQAGHYRPQEIGGPDGHDGDETDEEAEEGVESDADHESDESNGAGENEEPDDQEQDSAPERS
ncbi:hypothetical protein F4604DRAFT_1676371 [Suillus subluteus]|nr:hypothetical protein F4604DRAFT_1676371 [Suillus subluteus]